MKKRILLLAFPAALILSACNIDLPTNFNSSHSSSTKDNNLVDVELKDMNICVGSDETSRGVTWFSNTDIVGELQIAAYDLTSTNSFESLNYAEYKAKTNASTENGYYSNQVEVTSLLPDTNYAFRYGNGDTWSEYVCFSTPEIQDDYTEFLAFGDPQIGASTDEELDAKNFMDTLSLATDTYPNCSFALSLGDQSNEFYNITTIARQYSYFINDINTINLPFAITVGNHEVHCSLISEHFYRPNINDYVGTDTASLTGDYYFTNGNALIIVLNCSYSYDCNIHSKFIKNTLKKYKDDSNIKWNIVAFHHSIYSVAGHASSEYTLDLRDNLSPILYDNNIDLVLMGHDHVYVRSHIMTKSKDSDIKGLVPVVKFNEDGSPLNTLATPDGPLFITLNSSSNSKHYELIEKDFDYAALVYQEEKSFYSHIDMSSNSLTISTYRSPDNNLIDNVTITK